MDRLCFYLRYQILSNPDWTRMYPVNQAMASRIKEAIKLLAPDN
ncbi:MULTISPECIES: hypothetical protein [unclassified Streptococcus]|nr:MULTISPECIES: hypothetical protein [unclassified Streptococcus]